MEWKESEHPRDSDGKFIAKEQKRNLLSDFIRLPDENIPKSVGAKWRNQKIYLPDGRVASFMEGSKLQNTEVFEKNEQGASYETERICRSPISLRKPHRPHPANHRRRPFPFGGNR